jgi:hypothetical protein
MAPQAGSKPAIDNVIKAAATRNHAAQIRPALGEFFDVEMHDKLLYGQALRDA